MLGGPALGPCLLRFTGIVAAPTGRRPGDLPVRPAAGRRGLAAAAVHPPASALLHRQYTLVYQPSVRMMDRRWPGRVAEVIGDEVWTWRQEAGAKLYEGEALVRNGRPIDGYVLRVRDGTPGQ